MDKSWISKPRLSQDYLSGIKNFLDFSFGKLKTDVVKCPCQRCGLVKYKVRSEVEDDLICHGFLSTYTNWYFHGEELDEDEQQGVTLEPESNVEKQSFRVETINLLNDVFPMMNDSFDESAQSASSSPREDHPKQNEAFEELLSDCNEALYEGCQTFSKLSFMLKLFHIKCISRITDKGMSMVINLLKEAFPHAKIPGSFNDMKKIISKLGFNYERIHVCPNDCMLYWGEDASKEKCKVCDRSRWKALEATTCQGSREKRKKQQPDWRLVPAHKKENAWKVIQKKFWFDDANRRKKYVISALGGRCKDLKQRIWKKYKQNTPQEAIDARPPLIPKDQWTDFVYTQFSEQTKKLSERNKTNRSFLKIGHALGRKTIARKSDEMEEETGVEPSRGELFIASRTRVDGSMVCEEARVYAEKVKEAMNQEVPGGETDAFAQVFGPEHSGRVRCIGRGPTPSKFFSISDKDMVEMKSQMMKLQVQNAEFEAMKSQMQKLQVQNAELEEMKSQMMKLQVQNAEFEAMKSQMQKLQVQNAELEEMKSRMMRYQMQNVETMEMFGGKLDIVASALQKVVQVKINGEDIEFEKSIVANEQDNENGLESGTKRLHKTTAKGGIKRLYKTLSGTSSVSTNVELKEAGTQRCKKKSKSSVDSPKAIEETKVTSSVSTNVVKKESGTQRRKKKSKSSVDSPKEAGLAV